ncbi:MAG: hypothetical protein ABIB04_00465 [Patescibacteria group bacterium]
MFYLNLPFNMGVVMEDQAKTQRTEILSKLEQLFGFSAKEAVAILNRDFFTGMEKRAIETWLYRIAIQMDRADGRKFIEVCLFCTEHRASRVEWLLTFFKEGGFTENEARKILIRCVKLASIPRNQLLKVHKALCLVLPDETCRRLLINAHPRVYLLPSASLKRKRYLRWSDNPDTFWDNLHSDIDPDAPELQAQDPEYAASGRDWQNDLRFAVLKRTRDWDEEKWRGFATIHPWIFDPLGTAPKVLDELSLWLDLPATVQHWPDPSEIFLVRICIEIKLHPILRLRREILYRRLFAIRRYLEIDFRSKPEVLLEPWETLPAHELRYRFHEMEARGIDPRYTSWTDFLLAPKRSEFIEKISCLRV